MPRLQIWKGIVINTQNSLEPLMKLKYDLTVKLLGQAYEISESDLIQEVEKLKSEF